MDKDEFSFTTQVDVTQIEGLNSAWCVPGVDIDTGRPEATIKWHLDFEARERGIKSIYIIIDSVFCEIEWEVTGVEDLTEQEKEELIIGAQGTEYRNETIGATIEINSNEKWGEKEWTINSEEFTFKSDGECMPSDCEIDFKEMTIKVS